MWPEKPGADSSNLLKDVNAEFKLMRSCFEKVLISISMHVTSFLYSLNHRLKAVHTYLIVKFLVNFVLNVWIFTHEEQTKPHCDCNSLNASNIEVFDHHLCVFICKPTSDRYNKLTCAFMKKIRANLSTVLSHSAQQFLKGRNEKLVRVHHIIPSKQESLWPLKA